MNGGDPRFAAGAWYIEQGFLAFTLWGTDENGVCRCPRGALCGLEGPGQRPGQKPGKHPVWSSDSQHGFKDATADPARLETLLRAASRPNLGVLVPEDCFGWDLDGDDAERIVKLQSSLGQLPLTMGHETPNGRHAIFRWPADVPRPDGSLLGVVTRWRHNGYLVAASSRIGTKTYRLLRDEAGDPLPIVEFPRPWVEAALKYRSAARPPATETPNGKRHPDLKSTARYLSGRGVHGEGLFKALAAQNSLYPGGAKPDRELRDLVAWADANIEEDADLEPIAPAGFDCAATIAPPADLDSWHVEGLIRPRSLVVIAAMEGLAKTQLALELAIRTATGTGSLAGHFAIREPLTVAYVDEENGPAELYRREEMIRAVLGLERSTLTRLHRVSFAGVHLGRQPSQTWLLDQLRAIHPDVLVLDTGGAMLDDEWGAPLKDGIRYLRAVIAELGCSIVVLTHLVKPARDGKRHGVHGAALTDVMGQWARHADAVATMSDLGADRVRLLVRKRVPPVSLVLAKRDGIFDTVAVTAGDEAPASVDDRVLRAIAAGADAADEIRTALGAPDRQLAKRTFYDTLARLRRDGFVEDGTPLRLTATGREAVE